MGKRLLTEAKNCRLIPNDSVITFTDNWNKLANHHKCINKPTRLLINATYLFASRSLDVDLLVKCVNAFLNCPCNEQFCFSYINTNRKKAGEKYEQFKFELRDKFKSYGFREQSILYRNYDGKTTRKAKFVCEMLQFRG